jgi:ATP-dependent Clp protease ATP-binding subunit ClpA
VFDRFTQRARRVIILAQEEAKRLDHSALGAEHILLGIIREGEGIASKVLESLTISPERVRAEIEGAIGRGERALHEEVAFTPRAKKVLELALDEARRLGHNYIGTEHLLLGIVRLGEGEAARGLIDLGANASAVRSQVIRIVSKKNEVWPPARVARPWWAAARGRTAPLPDLAGRRMTPGARLAILSAQGEAAERKDAAIGTGHVMLGLIRHASNSLTQLLAGSGETGPIEPLIERVMAETPDESQPAGNGLTRAAESALSAASREARARGHYLLGLPHLLLGHP